MLDKDGYPTKRELNYIKKFDITKKDPIILMKYIQERWWPFTNSGFSIKEGLSLNQQVYKIEFSTWGWSGNEELLEALEECKYFNNFYQTSWKRGGHYMYEIPVK